MSIRALNPGRRVSESGPALKRNQATLRGTSKKAPPTADAVHEYLARVPDPARTTMEKLRAAIRSAAPREATEKLYYAMPAFHYKGALVAYAAFKAHCSLFPLSAAIIKEFADDLSGYTTSKGTIRFPLDKPLPAALLRKIVKARVAERERKAASRKPGASRSRS